MELPDRLKQEWDSSNTIPISAASPGSHKKIKWRCIEKGHLWEAPVHSRVSQNSNCPICSNRKILVGYNDLSTTNPNLSSEWSDRNTKTPQEVVAGTAKKAWWVCENSHEWQASISSRVSGRGCPFCSNNKVLVGFNDLATTHSELSKEWDHKKNKKRPTQVTGGHNSKVWWVCEKYGHSWQASPNARTYRNLGCPYCSNRRVICGFNDVGCKLPHLAAAWSNLNSKSLHEVSASSDFKCLWICPSGHYYSSTVKEASKGKGCPVCSGKRVMPGYNDLLTIMPTLVTEWSFSNQRSIDSVTVGSGYRATWVCENEHTWVTGVDKRTSETARTGCPHCSNQASKIELEIKNALKKEGFRVSTSGVVPNLFWSNGHPYKCDVLIEDLKVVVEYDGAYWHKYKEDKDFTKTQNLLHAGYCVLRIRENPLQGLSIYSSQYEEIFYRFSSFKTSLILQNISKIVTRLSESTKRGRQTSD